MSKLRTVKQFRWIIIKAVEGIHSAMCRKKAWEKICSFLLYLIYFQKLNFPHWWLRFVCIQQPRKKVFSNRIFAFEVTILCQWQEKEKKVGNASLSGFNFWQTEAHRYCLLVVAAVLLGLAYVTGVYTAPLPNLACSVINLAWSSHSPFIKLICL